VLSHQVGIGAGQGVAHIEGVFLVNAKDYRLGVGVAVAQVLGQVVGYCFGAGEERDDALELFCAVQAGRHLAPKAVEHAGVNVQAVGVHVHCHPHHAVGSQEAVRDALAQAVGIDGRAEIVVGVHVVIPLGGGGHADLLSRLKVFQDFAPRTLLAGAAAMALVHENQVEKVGRVLLVEIRPFPGAG